MVISNAMEMRHGGSRALHAYWAALRGDRAAPYKAEVTAPGLGPALADHVFTLESLGSGAFRFRDAGPALYELFGMEMRGMGAEAAMEGESRRRFVELAERVLAAGGVGVARGEALGDDSLPVEFVLLPLLSDFGRADRLLGAVHIAEAGDISANPPRAARRCRLREVGLASAAPRRRRPAQPLPGFAEPALSFSHTRPAPKPEEGESGSAESPRRDHLKIVKE